MDAYFETMFLKQTEVRIQSVYSKTKQLYSMKRKAANRRGVLVSKGRRWLWHCWCFVLSKECREERKSDYCFVPTGDFCLLIPPRKCVNAVRVGWCVSWGVPPRGFNIFIALSFLPCVSVSEAWNGPTYTY